MTVDEARLDRRMSALIDAAKRRNRYTDKDLSQYLTVSAGTLANKRSGRMLHTLSARDLVMLQKIAGEELKLEGL